MEIEPVGAGVFKIRDFLSPQECKDYIASSQRTGYEEAVIQTEEGARLLKEARNNDRIVFDDPALAAHLYQRAQPLLPAQLDGWTLCGFNERWRYYRYEHQQFFKWHKDGTYRRSDQEESFLTFMIYLNDDFEGGQTAFQWESVQPKTGMALVFPHRMTHQGAPVTAGVKYVLRTDVLYRATAQPPCPDS